MKPVGKRHGIAPVQLGGMFSAGDPSAIPDGTVRTLRNYVVRPGRFECRPTFSRETYLVAGQQTALKTISGYVVWQDVANELTWIGLANDTDSHLYLRNPNTNPYSANATGTLPAGRLTSYANMLGKVYMMFDAGTNTTPSASAVYDGTTLSTTPFNTAIVSRAVASFVDRLFFANPRVSFTTLATLTDTYDWTGSDWSATQVKASALTLATGDVVCRLSPQSSASQACSIIGQVSGTITVYGQVTSGTLGLFAISAGGDSRMTWRFDYRGVDSSYDVPVTLELVMLMPRLDSFAYSLGMYCTATASDSKRYRYRITTAGTSAGAAPTFGAAIGGTTADNTATWTNEGPEVLASLETTIANATRQPDWASYFLTAILPASTNGYTVSPRLKFYNTGYSTLGTLAPIDISLKDGKADADGGKANHGQQWTVGDFCYPFLNKESSQSATQNIDALIWSEINNPKSIKAASTFPLVEIGGLATAMAVTNGRLVVFKRRGMWIFKGVADPYEPALPEMPAIRVGCLGPLALDVSRDGNLYWIGEQHVYRMNVGSDSQPSEIDTPGMYEEIFGGTSDSTSKWVEWQATYNRPLLAIDHVNNDVWVYTQKGKIYIYNIATQAWSYIDANPTGTAPEVEAMIFDPVSQRMLVSWGGYAATHSDATIDTQDLIDATGTNTNTLWNITNDIVPKPFELFSPRYLASLKEIGLFHLATVQNGSLSLSYSTDRGATYTMPSGYPLTSWLSSPRIVLPVLVTGPSIMVKISRTGSGGARNWSVSKCDSTLFVHRGEFPFVTNT